MLHSGFDVRARHHRGHDLHGVGVQWRCDIGGPADVLAADGHRLDRAEAEQIVLRAADQRAAAQAVVVELAVACEAAHDRDRDAAELALHQIARGGELVRDRDLRDVEDVAVHVAATARVGDGGESGDPDRGVGDSGAPRPSHRVADHDTDIDAEPVGKRLAQQLRGRVRIHRQERDLVAGDVGQVDAGAGQDQPVPGLDDAQLTARRHHASGLGVDRPLPRVLAGVLVSRVENDQPALGLRHDLRGDHKDVAVLERRRVLRDHLGQVVAGPQLADAENRQDLQTRRGVIAHATSSSAVRTIAAVASSSVMSSGIARTATPGTDAVSVSWISQPSSRPPSLRAP